MSKNLGDHPEIKQPTDVVPWFVLGNSHFSDPHQKKCRQDCSEYKTTQKY